MIRYIKNHFKKRREFKESIKGIFDDWEVGPAGTTLESKAYYIGTYKTLFESSIYDMPYGDYFISRFNNWEKSILLKEALRVMKPERSRIELKYKKSQLMQQQKEVEERKAINKEFNLK